MSWLCAIVSCAAGALIFLLLIKLLRNPASSGGPASAMRVEQRHWPRFAARGAYEVYWQDSEGRPRHCGARSINVSQTGLALETRHPIETGNLLNLRGKGTKLVGAAWVRHCTGARRSWVVGVELKGAMSADS